MKRRKHPLRTLSLAALAVTVAATLAASLPATAAPTTHVHQVSVAADGSPTNGDSSGCGVSADGRYIAFASAASDLVPGDTNDSWDVFVRDQVTGTTQRVSLDSNGGELPGLSFGGSISADGRYVVFESALSNFAASDNGYGIFVHDRVTGSTLPVSVDRAGEPARALDATISADGHHVVFASTERLLRRDANGRAATDVYMRNLRTGRTRLLSKTRFNGNADNWADSASVSAHGRYVAFQASAGLIAGDTNHTRDVYVRDTVGHSIRRVSVTSRGKQANHGSMGPAISGNGRYVAFGSFATNLVRHDTNGTWDVFVHDRRTGKTHRVSFGGSWRQADGPSAAAGQSPLISANGRFVAFNSTATNLVRGDRNGNVDVFLRDRAGRTTTLVSHAPDGRSGDGGSVVCALAPDGRTVVFTSGATDLVPGDSNGFSDVFLFR